MKLRIIVVALLMVGTGMAQDPCSVWQRTGFKSKADCEETAKISDEWNGFCAKAHEKAGLWPENLSVADRASHEFCLLVCLIVVALLMVGTGMAQDPCSVWQRTGFKSKADCEETEH